MLTLFVVIIGFVMIALAIPVVAGIIAMSPVILAFVGLLLIDMLVIKIFFRGKKKKKKE